LAAGKAVGADRKFDGLENCGLAGIVVAEEDDCPNQFYVRESNPAKILNVNMDNPHARAPPLHFSIVINLARHVSHPNSI
jgi:hypothetical protein